MAKDPNSCFICVTGCAGQRRSGKRNILKISGIIHFQPESERKEDEKALQLRPRCDWTLGGFRCSGGGSAAGQFSKRVSASAWLKKEHSRKSCVIEYLPFSPCSAKMEGKRKRAAWLFPVVRLMKPFPQVIVHFCYSHVGGL